MDTSETGLEKIKSLFLPFPFPNKAKNCNFVCGVIWLFSYLVGSNDYQRPDDQTTNQITKQLTTQTTKKQCPASYEPLSHYSQL